MKLSVKYDLSTVLKSFTQSRNRGYEVLAARSECERKLAIYHARLQETLNDIQAEQQKLQNLESIHGIEYAATNLLIQKVHQASREDIVLALEETTAFISKLKEEDASLLVLCKRHYHDLLKLSMEEKEKMVAMQSEDFRRWKRMAQINAAIESAQRDADSYQFCLKLWDERNPEK